jgi:YVTN family beta-propeller protein
MIALGLLLLSQPVPYIEAVIPVDVEPRYFCWVGQHDKVFCACVHNSRMAVINGSSNSLESTFDVGAGPQDMYYDSVDSRLLLANRLDSTVMAIDPSSNAVTDTVRFAGMPSSFGHNLVQQRLYVTLYDLDQVAVLQAAGLERMATIRTGDAPVAVVWNPNGDKIYVANEYGTTVQVFSGRSHGVLATIPAGRLAMKAWLDPGTNRLWVLNYASEDFTVIDCSTDVWVDTVAVGMGPAGLAYWERGRALYVSNSISNTLTKVDLGTNTTTTIPAGYRPSAMAVDESNGWLFVCVEGENQVKILDCNGDTLMYALEPGQLPVDLAWNPGHSRCYVANFYDNTVAVIRNPVGITEQTGPGSGTRPWVSPTIIARGLPLSVTWDDRAWPDARVLVRDMSGRSVAEIQGFSGSAQWDGRDRNGRRLPAGVYFFELRSPHVAAAARVNLLD